MTSFWLQSKPVGEGFCSALVNDTERIVCSMITD